MIVVDGFQSTGMHFLHSHNVCHRDLKSANVLFDRKLQVKLCDFAFSKFRQVQEAGDAAEAKFISSVGTPAWMAPEVLRGDECVAADVHNPSPIINDSISAAAREAWHGHLVTRRACSSCWLSALATEIERVRLCCRYTLKADVYACGVIMYELQSRRRPFAELNSFQIISRVGMDGKRLEMPPGCAPVWSSLATRCWEAEPHLRPTFAQLEEELKLAEDDAVL
jgi:serine/threonine protein kinase